MATLTTDGKGRRTIQFTDRDGKRKSVRLGPTPKAAALTIRSRVEDLLAARLQGRSPSRETLLWLGQIGPQLRDRLARAGLVEPMRTTSIAEWLARYLEERTDLAESTRTIFSRARRHLVAFFGEGRRLDAVSADDAARFAAWLRREAGLAENTARRTVGLARQLFAAARRRGLVEAQPFEGIPVATGGTHERRRFVAAETINRAIDAAPDAEWRALIAIARWCGVRVPSETADLEWSHVDFDRGRIRIRNVKTARSTGREFREVPLFPEVEPYLRDLLEIAAPGVPHVFPRLRERSAQRLTKNFLAILARAGAEPWPKPWTNLRATRATELADRHPAHVAAAWLGHSREIAERHYAQVTEAHFAAALGKTAQAKEVAATDGVIAGSSAGALQKAVQSGRASACTDRPARSSLRNKNRVPGSGNAVVRIGAGSEESCEWAIQALHRSTQSKA